MHRDLQKLLASAEGQSQKVVAVFIDVRGFSSWTAESTEVADYLKSAYNRILTKHFDDAGFFKLTGDGMMLIYPFNDVSTLQSTLRATIEKSIELVKAFPTLTKDDRMINFQVPTRLGVGLARGSATVLASDGKTLDYTGRTLNLAARLMDLARPFGVVFDDSFGIEELTTAVRKKFAHADVYVNGIAEESSIRVYYLPGWTTIAEHRKLPISAPIMMADVTKKLTLKALKDRGSFLEELEGEPAQPTAGATLIVEYPAVRDDGTETGLLWTLDRQAVIERKLNTWYAKIDYDEIAKKVEARRCQDDWTVRTTLEYLVRPTVV
jgi:class 3 adenylate cyclase